MPVAHFHLVRGTFTPDQGRELLVRASAVYAEVLDSPIERIRVVLVPVEPDLLAVGGVPVADGGAPAPYFTAVVLAGRPAPQRAELLRRLTGLLVELLDVPASAVRGHVVEVHPENWGIGGTPASVARAGRLPSADDARA
ncbi:tautomerase family protein [Pseudonocardia kujensis]|uniref:tautomerase family protein n=1 Tax=Pseudonocardia kujensis TaxID=1128675 RepID=UPI001E4DA17C|nr:tautomerase family protein [Pseudonocardia kujensis]MCE0765778.1 tautomerase family protein [Pseudonocardia kujensis]